MSHFQKYFRVNIVFVLLLFVLKIKVFGDKIEQSIYKKITGYAPCVTLLNATHQIGCTSKRKGDVGVVHYIDSEESFKWLLNNGNHAPYIALFTAEYFTDDRLKLLVNAAKVSGALVIYDPSYNINGTKPPRAGFSPEYPCPNENFGLYSSDETYSCSKNGSNSVIWNENGSEMLYRDYDVPVFTLYKKDEIDDLINCYKNHNKPVNDKNPDYPLCGAELLSFMFAAKDTPTCIRKTNAPLFTPTGFCDALGDKNVWGTLFPLFFDNITKNDIVLATAKLDSTAFFHHVAFGADNDATGVIVLLAAAEALGNLKRNEEIKRPDLEKNQKHIMFSFFQGEAWDYIGSSRMVYDMMNGDFPCYDNKDCRLPSFDLSNIAYYLELNQVGKLDEDALWAHRDPESKDDVRTKTRTMFGILSKFGASMNMSIQDPSQSKLQPLPPASFQRFLKKNRTIPGLVITDHKASYTNKFYNSRFDDPQNLGVQNVNSSVVKHLTSLATTVAKTLYQLAYNETRDDINVTENRVYDLLRCFLGPPICSIFKQVLSNKSVKTLESLSLLHFNRYVGPYEKTNGPAFMTTMTKFLLAYFTGIHNVTCSSNNKANYYVFKENNGTCVGAPVYFSPALSPAFLLKDYDSIEYSTWTESRWANDVGIRMFLIADPTQEAITLAVGIVLTLISLVVTVFMYMKAEQLFTPGDCVLMISNDM